MATLRQLRPLAVACALLAFALLGSALRAGAQSESDATDPPDAQAPEGNEAILFREIPVVFGASRYDQKVTEAPSSVTLITSDQIKYSGARTLADVLRYASGFFVTYDRNYNYIGLRGFNRPGDFNSRILLLIDGHRLNDNLYDQAGFGTESLIDVDLVERVEIIRGPSSSLYGTNAFLGVINVVTKRGRDIGGAELSGEVGSYESYKGRVTYGAKLESGMEMLLSGSYYDSQGHHKLHYDEFAGVANNGDAIDADDDAFPSGFAKLTFRDFSFQGGFVSREKGIPTASYGTAFNTDRTRSLDQHGYADLGFRHDFENDLAMTGRIYYDQFYYRGDYFYDTPTAVLNRDRSTGEGWGSELKLDRRFFESHKVTAGTEYHDDFRQDLSNADTNPTISYLDAHEASSNWALFLQDEYSILDNLILNAGARYDAYDSFGGTLNPRIALIYNVDQTTIKALYGQAFRAPSAYERFYVGTGFKASDDLQPETIRTYELVLERVFAQRVRASGSGYYYKIRNLISQVTDPSDGMLVFENAGSTGAMGLELQLALEGQWPLGLDGSLSYAIQRATDLDTHDRLTNSPQHLVKLNLVLPLFDERLFASMDVQYMSARRTLAGDEAGGFSTTNLTLFSQHVLRGVELSASVNNLFDAKYGDPGSGEHVQDVIRQDGRTFWLKVKYGF